VRQHGAGEGLDVLGHDERATFDERPRLREGQERDPRPGASAEREPRACARMAQERDHEPCDALLDVDVPDGPDRREQVGMARDRTKVVERRRRGLLREHPGLVVVWWIADRHSHRRLSDTAIDRSHV
jgi:hypothetical protein